MSGGTMTKQTILDRVLEHDMLRVNIESRLDTILRMCDEIGVCDVCLYLMDSASEISWTVCNGFLGVRLERHDCDLGAEEDYIGIPFEWLDMSDADLKEILEQEVEKQESQEYQRAIDQLYRDAEYYGYTLTEIR
tara:strand:- start:139 stop:543 length:405 start_codon:yes stop_codon:yes gene_type:complete